MTGDEHPVTLENGEVRVLVLPALGGKMISLKRLARTEFLLPPPEPERDYRPAQWRDDGAGSDDKLFAGRLQNGLCALYRPAERRSDRLSL